MAKMKPELWPILVGTAQAIYTMFEITFAGSWPMYARPVIEDIAVGTLI